MAYMSPFSEYDQIQYLRDKIMDGQNVVLYGEYPSLVPEVFRLIVKSHDVVRMDLGSTATADDVISRISNAIHRLPVRGRPKEVARRLFLRIAKSRPRQDWRYSIQDMFAYIEKSFKEKPLVIFLDEFQGVLNCQDSDQLIALLRAHIQHQPQIPYLFAGSNRLQMYDIFMNPSSPFFKSALPMEIETAI